MSGGVINLKWTWLILAVICIVFYFFVLISYYLSYRNTVLYHDDIIRTRGYSNLLTFSNWFILPLGIGFGIAYYVFAIVMDHSKHKISKASRKKGNNSDD